jgi:hypothetical protein
MQHMVLEIQVLDWDRYTIVAGLNWLTLVHIPCIAVTVIFMKMVFLNIFFLYSRP